MCSLRRNLNSAALPFSDVFPRIYAATQWEKRERKKQTDIYIYTIYIEREREKAHPRAQKYVAQKPSCPFIIIIISPRRCAYDIFIATAM